MRERHIEEDKAIDFDRAAEFYDLYSATTFDVAFWAVAMRASPAPRLELMCGTGRLCLALLERGIEIDGFDYSPRMLAEFEAKAKTAGYRGRILQGDARTFELGHRYGTIVLAFQSIAEVVADEDKKRVFSHVARHLLPGGRFWLTAHNPPLRRGFYDGAVRDLGQHQLQATGEAVAVSGSWKLDEATAIVTGEQRYVCTRDGQPTRTVVLPMRFHLVEPSWLDATLSAAGFQAVHTYGDYGGGAFDPNSSPFWIAEYAAPAA